MTTLFSQAMVVARRDFLAIVATPTFLLFLFAPLLMLILPAVLGSGLASMATESGDRSRIVAIATGVAAQRLEASDSALRRLYRAGEAPPRLEIVAPARDPAAQAQTILANGGDATRAVLRGPLNAPTILFVPPSRRHGDYLAELAEQAVRADRSGLAAGARLSRPTLTPAGKQSASPVERKASGFGAVFVIFFLTLLLAGQTVGMLAEEKSNKVIEILAASVRLEAVFLGKLIGMFGVAVLFVGFWGLFIGGALQFVPRDSGIANFSPAVGIPLFLILCGAYFTMAFMLLGAIFLGVGAQASTMREIQMLSLPITILQVGMFGLASAAASDPGSALARFAEIFPFSSPFAMAARASADPVLWPHLAALAWQSLWVTIIIMIASRLFRLGVLKSGGGWRALLGRSSGARQSPSQSY
jgi:ABC-2 type transport system permease protein